MLLNDSVTPKYLYLLHFFSVLICRSSALSSSALRYSVFDTVKPYLSYSSFNLLSMQLAYNDLIVDDECRYIYFSLIISASSKYILNSVAAR